MTRNRLEVSALVILRMTFRKNRTKEAGNCRELVDPLKLESTNRADEYFSFNLRSNSSNRGIGLLLLARARLS